MIRLLFVCLCRKREETVIEKLEPYLLTAKRKIRKLTLLTKQDLWWKERAAVQKHYEEGTYGRVINRIQEGRMRL
jgi:hypothetical protein